MTTQRSISRGFVCQMLVCISAIMILSMLWSPSHARAQGADSRDAPDWLEPGGLNIVDLVGELPEAQLQDAIISFSGEGMVQYISGQREGNQVTINARIYTKALGNDAYFNCLGQWAFLDQWPSTTPAGTLRLYENGAEITDQVTFVQYYPAGQNPPNHAATTTRYDRTAAERVTFTTGGAVDLRANMGCILAIPGDHREMTAEFTVERPRQLSVEVVGEETFTFHSYIGPGDAGRVNSLRGQMASRFGNRHDKFTLTPPDDAEYVLVTYPPTPVSPYPTGPVDGPSSGTYRLAHGHNVLSVDHTISMGLPLYGQWRDADQSGGTEYLPQINDVDTLTSPEYFVPTEVTYDPCMSDGGCSPELLDQIYGAEMSMTITYLQVDRLGDGLDSIPLRQVGSGWSQLITSLVSSTGLRQTPWFDADFSVFVPIIANGANLPPDDNAGCPCGWFDANGAMLDFIAAP